MIQKRIHIDWLDSLRGFAVLFVMAYHCLSWIFSVNQLPWAGNFRDVNQPVDFLIFTPITFGWSGVAVFFVISGFCIHLSYRQQNNFLRFYWKRFWRIYPPYFIALVLFFFTDMARGSFVADKDGLSQLITHLFLIHNFWGNTHFGINPSFWSIAVEAQLYAVYPLLIILQQRFNWKRAMCIAIMLELFCNLTTGRLGMSVSAQRLFSNGPFCYWFSWSIGAYLAHSMLEHRSCLWPRLASPYPLFVLVLTTWFYRPLNSLAFDSVSLLTASLIAKRLSQTPPFKESQRISKNLNPRFIGIISYSLYLLHQPIISLTNKILTRFDSYSQLPRPSQYFVLFAISGILSIAVSCVFYRYIERTSIRIGNILSLRFAKSP